MAYELMMGSVLACCTCGRIDSMKKTFPCGHKICLFPCSATLRSGNLAKSKGAIVCPVCEGDLKTKDPTTPTSRDTVDPEKNSTPSNFKQSSAEWKLDTMPTREPPPPPVLDQSSERINLARRLLEESSTCGCKKVSVRIFCKHSSVNPKSSDTHCKDSCDTVATECISTEKISEKDQKVFDLLQELKEAELKIPAIIDSAQVRHRKIMNTLGDEIKETALKLKMALLEDEDSLLQELAEIASERNTFFVGLYDTYDELLQKEHEVEDKLSEAVTKEDNDKTLLMKEVETAIKELTNKVRGIENKCAEATPDLRFVPCANREGNVLGTLGVKTSSGRPKMTPPRPPLGTVTDGDKEERKNINRKQQEIYFDTLCIGVVWLDDQHFISVVDINRSDDNGIQIQVYTTITNDNSIAKKGNSFLVKKRVKTADHDLVNVCNTVGPDDVTILLSLGKDIIRVTADISGSEPTFVSKLTKLQKTVYGLAWAKESDQWYVLFSNPWSIYLVTDSVSTVHRRSLASTWYHPNLYSFKSYIAVSDISKNVFKIYDMDGKKKARQISPMNNTLTPIWPAGVSFDEVNEKWLLLWKTVGGIREENGEWFITRHHISKDDCELVKRGSLSEGDPMFIAFRNGRLSVLYHCGRMCLYKLEQWLPLKST